MEKRREISKAGDGRGQPGQGTETGTAGGRKQTATDCQPWILSRKRHLLCQFLPDISLPPRNTSRKYERALIGPV